MEKREQAGHDQVTLGPYLRSVRESLRMKLREVEDASGVSNAYLSQLETGKIAKPSPHILHKIASVYNVSYEILMDKAGYLVRTADKQGEDEPTIRGSRIPTKALQGLTADEEDAVLKYIEFLRYQRKKD
jgi:transcriptional regulator with XRE-family HTH domain